MSETWFDIHVNPMPTCTPVLTLRKGGFVDFGCYYKSKHIRGIAKLEYDSKDEAFKADGKTYLLCVTHWRDITDNDLFQKPLDLTVKF
jgi:hypothetical protein